MFGGSIPLDRSEKNSNPKEKSNERFDIENMVERKIKLGPLEIYWTRFDGELLTFFAIFGKPRWKRSKKTLWHSSRPNLSGAKKTTWMPFGITTIAIDVGVSGWPFALQIVR